MIYHQKSINKCYNISKVKELTFALGVRRSFLEKVTIKINFERLDFDRNIRACTVEHSMCTKQHKQKYEDRKIRDVFYVTVLPETVQQVNSVFPT